MKVAFLNITLSAKTFLKQHFIKMIFAIASFYAPVAPLLLGAIMFSFADFITGIAASWKRAKAAGQSKWLDSKKMQKKVFDLCFYMLAIVLSYFIEQNFLAFFNLPICKLVSFIILSTEFWSNMENIGSITGLPLNKDAFMDLINKMRKSGVNIDVSQAISQPVAPLSTQATESNQSAQ